LAQQLYFTGSLEIGTDPLCPIQLKKQLANIQFHNIVSQGEAPKTRN